MAIDPDGGFFMTVSSDRGGTICFDDLALAVSFYEAKIVRAISIHSLGQFIEANIAASHHSAQIKSIVRRLLTILMVSDHQWCAFPSAEKLLNCGVSFYIDAQYFRLFFST